MKNIKLTLFALTLSATLMASTAFSETGGVLMIGDSLSVDKLSSKIIGLYGQEHGGHIRIIASGGSKPVDWTEGKPTYENTWGYSDFSESSREQKGSSAVSKNPYPSPKLPALLKKEKPEVVVIQQGTNLMWNLKDDSDLTKQKEQVQNLYDQIFSVNPPPKKCLWVAPPDTSLMSSTVEDRIFHMISDVVSKRCKVLDSRDPKRIGIYPRKVGKLGGDGVHHTGAFGGERIQNNWARAIVDEVKLLQASIPANKKAASREKSAPGRK